MVATTTPTPADQIKALRAVQFEQAGKAATLCLAYKAGKPLDAQGLAQACELAAGLDVAITALQDSVGSQ